MKDRAATKAYTKAIAAELALRALIDKRDVTEDDHRPVEAAYDVARMARPRSSEQIARYAQMSLMLGDHDLSTMQVLENIRDAAWQLSGLGGCCHSACCEEAYLTPTYTNAIRDAASMLAEQGVAAQNEVEERATSEVCGSTRFHAMQRFIPGVKSNTSVIA